jgi:hypothetical protein
MTAANGTFNHPERCYDSRGGLDMGNVAFKTERRLNDQATQQRADQFASELSELGRRYGIGLGGDSVLFLLEAGDYWFDYSVDGQSRLSLGNTEGDPTSRARRDA